jgi:hypothetical protein
VPLADFADRLDWLCSRCRAAFRQQFGRQCPRRMFTRTDSIVVVTGRAPSTAPRESGTKALATGAGSGRRRAVADRGRVPPVLGFWLNFRGRLRSVVVGGWAPPSGGLGISSDSHDRVYGTSGCRPLPMTETLLGCDRLLADSPALSQSPVSVNVFHPVLAGEMGWSAGVVTRQGPSSLAW